MRQTSIFAWNTITTTPKRKPPHRHGLDIEVNADISHVEDLIKLVEETNEDILHREKEEVTI